MHKSGRGGAESLNHDTPAGTHKIIFVYLGSLVPISLVFKHLSTAEHNKTETSRKVTPRKIFSCIRCLEE